MTEEWPGDVGIDIGMRRLAYAWPHWGLAGSYDLGDANNGLTRDMELRMMQRFLVSVLPVGVQLWVDQAFAGKGAVAMAQRLTESISAVMTAQEWTRPPIVVHSSTWKSQVIGNHLAGKDEISGWLHDHEYNLWTKCSTEDEYDAMLIGVYGRERTAGRILAPEPKKRARRKAKK